MPGRGFLDVARDVATGPTEYHRRAAVVHAYYALLLECRDALFRWGFALPSQNALHSWVRLRFVYAADEDLKAIGDGLERLVRLRNRASYDLQSVAFKPGVPQAAFQAAETALALLDGIESDPVRRAAAVASIRP
jgi:hypothetical protein